jgi:Rod binding domain-containing protein
MDSTQSILIEIVPPTVQMEHSNKFDAIQEEKKKQTAKDFESVFIYKLLEEMKDTIGDWGLEKDEASSQVQGIFWLCLARDIANSGGFGLWKDVYQILNDSDRGQKTENRGQKTSDI